MLGFSKLVSYVVRQQPEPESATLFHLYNLVLAIYRNVLEQGIMASLFVAVVYLVLFLVRHTVVGRATAAAYAFPIATAVGIATAAAMLLVGPLFALLAVAHKWVFLGTVREAVHYAHRSLQHSLWIGAFSFGMNASGLMRLYSNTKVLNTLARMTGAKIGTNVRMSNYLASPEGDLLEVGDNTHIGSTAGIYQHNFSHGDLNFEQVKLGKACRIVSRLHLVPGTILADGVHVGPHSMVLPGRHLIRSANMQVDIVINSVGFTVL